MAHENNIYLQFEFPFLICLNFFIYFKLCLTGGTVIKTSLNSIRNTADSSRQTLSIHRPEDIHLWFETSSFFFKIHAYMEKKPLKLVKSQDSVFLNNYGTRESFL